MSIEYTSEDIVFREEVRAWFEKNTPSEIRGNQFMYGTMTPEQNRQWARKLHERRWAAINWPAEFGGTDWSQKRKFIFEQVRAETRAPGIFNVGISPLGPAIYTFGTDMQKAYYLPRILNYDDWWCQGFSEPEAGSDLASLKTYAKPDGDHYVVNGTKTWTSYAHLANLIFCLVRTSSEGKKQSGISFLLIDMSTPGIEVQPIRSMDGRHHLNRVMFTDVRVPKQNLVGEEGQGWTIAKFLLTHERTNVARLPLSRIELTKLKELAETQTGLEAVRDVENFAVRIAEIEIDLGCLEFMNAQMLDRVDSGEVPGAESSMLKLKATEMQQRIAELAFEVSGYLAINWPAENEKNPGPFSQLGPNYGFSRAATIYGGTSEVQHDVMAKALLGL